MKNASKELLRKLMTKYEEEKIAQITTANDEKYEKIKPKGIQKSNYIVNFIMLIMIAILSSLILNFETTIDVTIFITFILIASNILLSMVTETRSILIDVAVLIFIPLLYLVLFLFINFEYVPDIIGAFEFTTLFYFKLVVTFYSLTSLINITLTFFYNITLSKEKKEVIRLRINDCEKNRKISSEYEELFDLSLKDNDVMNELLTNEKFKDLISTKAYSIDRRVNEIEKEREEAKKQKRRLAAFSEQITIDDERKLELEISIENE